MRITLIRHGKPAFELRGNVPANALNEIVKSYDLSGIVGTPPKEVLSAVKGNHFVVCSHLLRSIESAKSLGYGEECIQEPLFRETAIPHFNSGRITLPIGVWVVILRVLWLFGFSRNGESLANLKLRARQAAVKLIQLAEEHQNVLLVGHGFINHFIAKELRKKGWFGPLKPGKEYWEYAIYEDKPK
ncbi:MAG: histidine phosphatase family protein [Candidatus Thiodiazotropha sp. LLP2]